MADVGEPQYFELRRSSRAEVSQAIAAIDDDRAAAIQLRGRLAEDLADGNVNRAADVSRVVFVRREYVDDLRGARRKHRGQLAMLNLAHATRALRQAR